MVSLVQIQFPLLKKKSFVENSSFSFSETIFHVIIVYDSGKHCTEDKLLGRKIGFVLKLLAGGYLIFVGVTLLNTILEVRPGNQEVMCGIAAIFILVGAVYLIVLLGGVIKRVIEERAAEYPLEMDPPYSAMPIRDQSIFRTAPMVILDKEYQTEGAQEGAPPEQMPREKAAVSRSEERRVGKECG